MTTPADPLVSEFETLDEGARHTAWIATELKRRRTDDRPPVPHDDVVRRIEELLVRQSPKAD